MRKIDRLFGPLTAALGWGPRSGTATARKAKIAAQAIASEFDAAFYVSQYSEIVSSGVDPLEHYVTVGWKEGRDPCAWFSTIAYLEGHPDVRKAGVNPFFHYVQFGKAEKRLVWPAGTSRNQLVQKENAALVKNPSLVDMIRYRERPIDVADRGFDPARLRFHWVVPDFQAGGGGHMTIFRMVRWLEFFGHECTIWIYNPTHHPTGVRAYDDIVKQFQPIKATVHPMSDAFFEATGDAVFATGWDTVWPVSHATGFKERFYFVQDYEPAFYARGSLSIAAEMTYGRDLSCICASPWLETLMRERHGRWARHFWLAVDREAYFEGPARPENEVPRIAFYSRRSTARRAVEIGMLALTVLAERGVVFHVDFYGAKLDTSAAPFSATDHGILEAEQLANLYRQADIGVCFSTTNYSLVPQEMMACGLPVLEMDCESTRAVFPEGVVTLAGPDPVDLADALEALLTDPARRRAQAEAASRWIADFSWEHAAHEVEAAVVERLTERGYDARPVVAVPAVASAPAAPHASVVIPTFNGGDLLVQVIDRVLAQRTPWPFELVIIDSTSTDGTAEACRARPSVRFVQIPQSEFAHGPTRNLGAATATGSFIAFLTQDALPADDFWLYNLVSALEHFPEAAGAFGRHIAWPSASPFTKRDLGRHFGQFDSQPIALSRDTNPELWRRGDREWRQKLHFYSDNNSCMRRSVWEKIPYPDVAYGEDQVWADEVIKAGFQKVYARWAAVFHSHDYDYEGVFERSKTEAIFFNEKFGYKILNEVPEKIIEGLNARDEAFAEQHRIDPAALATQKGLNEARVLGYLEGERAPSRPKADMPQKRHVSR